MKKITYLIISTILTFAFPAFAKPKYTKDMLDQVGSINARWQPIINPAVNAVYSIKFVDKTILVLRLYDRDKYVSDDVDPENIDAQAVFIKDEKGCRLISIVMSPVNIKPYIDIVVGGDLITKEQNK